MGNIFIILLNKIKFKIWRITFLKTKFTIKVIWDGLPVFAQETIYHVRTEMRRSLDVNVTDHLSIFQELCWYSCQAMMISLLYEGELMKKRGLIVSGKFITKIDKHNAKNKCGYVCLYLRNWKVLSCFMYIH